MSSSSLISELKFSLKTRGINFTENKKDCFENIENIAKLRSWKLKTIDKFKKYLSTSNIKQFHFYHYFRTFNYKKIYIL